MHSGAPERQGCPPGAQTQKKFKLVSLLLDGHVDGRVRRAHFIVKFALVAARHDEKNHDDQVLQTRKTTMILDVVLFRQHDRRGANLQV